LIHKNFL